MITNAAFGLFTYQFAAAEVVQARVGTYTLQITATFADASVVALDPVPWQLVPSL